MKHETLARVVAGIASPLLLLSLTDCEVAQNAESAPPAMRALSVDVCTAETLTPLDDLRLDRFVRVFVDNPDLVIAGDHAAATGAAVFLVRDSAPEGAADTQIGPYAAAMAVLIDSTGTLTSVIPLPASATTRAGVPLLSAHDPDQLSVAWSDYVVRGVDTTISLKAARWSRGQWSGDTVLKANASERLLSSAFTAPPAPFEDGVWSYATFIANDRVASLLLHERGRGWEADSVESPYMTNPTAATIGNTRLLVGLVGRKPHGNTVAAWPVPARGVSQWEEFRVSRTDQQLVQAARVFTVRNRELLAIWTGTRAEDEVQGRRTFFSSISRDSGRTWTPTAELQVAGDIFSWRAAMDAAGRVHVAANIGAGADSQEYRTHYLLFDEPHARWSTLWSSGDTLSSIGFPAVAILKDQSTLLLFETIARDGSTLRTYRTRLRVSCAS